MSGNGNRHIGDDQLVYGLPKHMAAVAENGDTTYWEIVPGKNACFTCRVMTGRRFPYRPSPVHPGCRCEVRPVARHAVNITDTLHGNGARRTERFGAEQKITVRITNLGPFFAGASILLDQME